MHCDVNAAGSIILAVEEASGVPIGADLPETSGLEDAAGWRRTRAAHRNAGTAARKIRATVRSFTLPGRVNNGSPPTP